MKERQNKQKFKQYMTTIGAKNVVDKSKHYSVDLKQATMKI